MKVSWLRYRINIKALHFTLRKPAICPMPLKDTSSGFSMRQQMPLSKTAVAEIFPENISCFLLHITFFTLLWNCLGNISYLWSSWMLDGITPDKRPEFNWEIDSSWNVKCIILNLWCMRLRILHKDRAERRNLDSQQWLTSLLLTNIKVIKTVKKRSVQMHDAACEERNTNINVFIFSIFSKIVFIITCSHLHAKVYIFLWLLPTTVAIDSKHSFNLIWLEWDGSIWYELP